ncbi:MAG TPA: hypothetical protein VF148_06560 [Acidimicrobiia bacterium]
MAILVSGCIAGADGPSPTDPHGFTTTTTIPVTVTTATVEESLGSFRECLRERGVGVGRIRLDVFGRPRLAEALRGLDLTDRDVLDALASCGQHLRAGALDLSSDPDLRELVQDTLVELADCLRSWGVEGFPDPVPGFDGVGSPFPDARIPWTDPDLPDAVAACRDMSTDS